MPHLLEERLLQPANHGQRPRHPRGQVQGRNHQADDGPLAVGGAQHGKCILCRRCETVCNQVQTVGALSVVGRGFTSVLCTAFNDPILTTNCVNCGQCVAVCPTSALSENSNIREVMQALADPGKTVVVQTAPACAWPSARISDWKAGASRAR